MEIVILFIAAAQDFVRRLFGWTILNGSCFYFNELAASILARNTPSVIAYGDATFPKGTASVVAAKFPAQPKGVPLGELAANAVSRLRGFFARGRGCCPCAATLTE